MCGIVFLSTTTGGVLRYICSFTFNGFSRAPLAVALAWNVKKTTSSLEGPYQKAGANLALKFCVCFYREEYTAEEKSFSPHRWFGSYVFRSWGREAIL